MNGGYLLYVLVLIHFYGTVLPLFEVDPTEVKLLFIVCSKTIFSFNLWMVAWEYESPPPIPSSTCIPKTPLTLGTPFKSW